MNSFSLCHFSPLTSPDTAPRHKVGASVKDSSDQDSVVSVLTRDIVKIAKSVSSKMNSRSDGTDGSDGESIFLTQRNGATEMNSFSLCHFSPLTSPDTAPRHKVGASVKDSSDQDSVVSVLTRDIVKIAKSVSSKMNSRSDGTDGSDGESIFLTQSFDKKKSKKKKSSRIKVIKVESPVEMNSEDDLFLSQSRNRTASPVAASKHNTKHDPVSTNMSHSHKKARRDYDSSDVPTDTESESDTEHSTQSDASPASPVKSSSSGVSDLTSDSESDNGATSEDTQSQNKSVELKSCVHTAKGNIALSLTKRQKGLTTFGKVKTIPRRMVSDASDTSDVIQAADSTSKSDEHNRKRKMPKMNTHSSDSEVDSTCSEIDSKHSEIDSDVSDIVSSSSENESSDNEDHTVEVNLSPRRKVNLSPRRKVNLSPRRKVKQKPDIRPELRQTKITDHCPVTPERVRSKTAIPKHQPLRYTSPGGFELTNDATTQYITQGEAHGKQLWLIKTPVGFDVSNLDGMQVPLNGDQPVCGSDKSDKQFEITATPSQEWGYSSVVAESSDRLAIGPAISGQIQVMDWIPGLMPVHLTRKRPSKHRLPDNLKPTFKPFGSVSPKRYNNGTEDDVEGQQDSEDHASRRRRKKQKEKKKRKKRENAQH